MENKHSEIKKSLTKFFLEKIEDFELVEGGKQRTIGDLVESKIVNIVKNNKCDVIEEVKLSKGKKSIEDVAFIYDGVKYHLDIKTHNVDAEFSMPNIISIEKLRKLITNKIKVEKPIKKPRKTKNPKKVNPPEELMLAIVDYKIESTIVKIKSITVLFIWELDISVLGVGALGNGQLQIKNANKALILTDIGKERWFKELVPEVLIYLDKQIIKINNLILEWSKIIM